MICTGRIAGYTDGAYFFTLTVVKRQAATKDIDAANALAN